MHGGQAKMVGERVNPTVVVVLLDEDAHMLFRGHETGKDAEHAKHVNS